MKGYGFMIVLTAWTALAGLPGKEDIKAVQNALEDQRQAWNRGDINTYMAGYWQSDDLVFVTKDAVTYGWQATLDRYISRYPSQKEMGRLTFTVIKTDPMSEGHILMIGKWRLDREGMDSPEGHFSLIWKKISGSWVIVADHSS